ncbi:uncharacterized protein EV420DRAFT_652820 [Desarmillaria tabescens]|uniref:RING-type domain-containing protein n=1 Tax=Armillaria tabescens TaxID=1929756 RepID=A0AA39NJR7_ARMTA|nr:uncharacterized protein EV420DRAFT_652820 [Desarmillaria tabescens]KAK0466877.1 hypothetical protein EV420DRAFT_652820 [Desarmillaria tabescens]
MIECIICQDPLTEPYSAPCGHIYCLECINNWFDATMRQRRPCTCPSCSAVVPKNQLRKVFIPQTDSLVHELYALRKEVKELDAYNTFLISEMERCEELRSAAEEKADLAMKKSGYSAAVNTFLSILTNIATLAGILTALFDDVIHLIVVVLCLISRLIWRLSTRPGECFQELGRCVWIVIRVITTMILLSFILMVMFWAVRSASVKIFQLFVAHVYPPLCELAKWAWKEVSTRFIDISTTFIRNHIIDFQAYRKQGTSLRTGVPMLDRLLSRNL